VKVDKLLIAGATVSGALCGVAHFFPPSQPSKPRGPIAYLLAVTYGTTAILAGVGIATDRKTLYRVTGITMAAGFVTYAGYAIDLLLNAAARERAFRGES